MGHDKKENLNRTIKGPPARMNRTRLCGQYKNPPKVEYWDLAGVAERQRRHSCFGLDSLVVIKMDIAVNHFVGLGECSRFVAVDALRFENREEIFCHCVVIRIPTS